MFDRILVPLDGSVTAEISLPYAEELCALFKSEITLVSVATSGSEASHLYSAYLQHISEDMTRRVSALADLTLPIKTELLNGKADEEIIKCSDRTNAGIVVMASRGSSGRLPDPGAVANRVLWGTTRPILLIRKSPDRKDNHNQLIHKMLLTLDGSERAESPLPMVTALASSNNAEVALIQVLEPIHIIPGFERISVNTLPQNSESVDRMATNYLSQVSARLTAQGIKTSIAAVWGSPAEGIIDFAENNGIDLIVISAHGWSGVTRWAFGSVTNKLLNAGNIPVLVMHPERDPI